MKPLGPGKARTELAENIAEIMGQVNQAMAESLGRTGDTLAWSPNGYDVRVLSALIGGAINQSLQDLFTEVIGNPDNARPVFWRYFNHNLWDLTRTLKASNLLDKVK